jgi:hypothetical protein
MALAAAAKAYAVAQALMNPIAAAAGLAAAASVAAFAHAKMGGAADEAKSKLAAATDQQKKLADAVNEATKSLQAQNDALKNGKQGDLAKVSDQPLAMFSDTQLANGPARAAQLRAERAAAGGGGAMPAPQRILQFAGSFAGQNISRMSGFDSQAREQVDVDKQQLDQIKNLNKSAVDILEAIRESRTDELVVD